MNNKHAYSAGAFDFFVINVVPEQAWYIVPQSDVAGMRYLSLYPHNRVGRYEVYREDWQRLGVPVVSADEKRDGIGAWHLEKIAKATSVMPLFDVQ